jgi:hypothetical protein
MITVRFGRRSWVQCRRALLQVFGILLGACDRAESANSVVATATDRSASSTAIGSEQSAREFFQAFIDWYLIGADTTTGPAYFRVLNVSQKYITDELAIALREDSLARNSTPETREYLNADPILASQDPCPRYAVSGATPTGGGYRVIVKPQCNDPRGEQDGPAIEVVPMTDSWRISNVHFEGTNLKRLLCQYATADSRPSARPAKCEVK